MSGRKASFAEFRENWRLLIACTLGTAIGFPTLCFYTVGIFAPIFAREFGWSMSTILAGLALTPVILLVVGPAIGMLADRWGSRCVATGSMALLGLAYTGIAFSNGSASLYFATWVLIALAGTGASPTSFTRAVNGIFVERRGMAIGIMLSGTGIFAFAIKPLAALAIAELGWRTAIVAIGLLPIVIGAPVAWWGLAARSGDRQQPTSPVAVSGEARPELTLGQALRTRLFLTLALALFTVALALGAPIPNVETILMQRGFRAADIVALASVIGLSSMAGRLGGGYMVDRLHAPFVGAAVVLVAAGGCWLLSDPSSGFLMSMLSIALMGFAGGVEVDLAAFLVARYVGVRHYGAVYAVLFGLFSIGAGSGPALLGYIYDHTGSFDVILKGCSLLMILSSGLLISLDPWPRGRVLLRAGRYAAPAP